MGPPKGIPIQIWDAIGNDDVAEVRRLFRENPEEINGYTFFGGGTYLHYAASHSSIGMVETLVAIGFEINKPGQFDGDTALVNACGYGNFEIAEYLLDHGALVDVSLSIRNPLFACIGAYANSKTPRENFRRVAELLLDRGIDATVKYTSRTMVDMDALAFACMWGDDDIAELIADRLYGADQIARTRAFEEARLVAHGNATSREKFRRLRYPPRARRSKTD